VEPAYCTILAQNYLPKALALATSLRERQGLDLKILLIDAETDADLPDIPGASLLSLQFLGLESAELHRLAAAYDLVEFATAVKPRFLQRLLEDSDQAAYLDPDTFVVNPMTELPVDLAASPGGILLTPHYLVPPGAGAFANEGHLLYVGVYNLGFVAVDRRAGAFLDWWWGKLREECLFDVLSGLFVDQKWIDIGAVYYDATAWTHPGYNVSVMNLHERPLSFESGDLLVGDPRAGGSKPLRLFHFHAFDAHRPEELSTRFSVSTSSMLEANSSLEDLCRRYADLVLHNIATLPAAPAYRFNVDSKGRELGRQVRRAHRKAGLAGLNPPSPFDPAQSSAYEQWRRSAWGEIGRDLVGDVAKAARATAPTAMGRLKDRLPGVAAFTRERFVSSSGIWR
jgi:hypothetical protein